MIFDPNLKCPLCGIRNAKHNGKRYVSREHVPPQSLFPQAGHNLITVPSCEVCNAGTSQLDEKFKISMGIYLGQKVPHFWEQTLKTLNHKKTYKKTLLSSISPVLTPFGNGEWRHRLPIDQVPIETVITKVARGLHWHVTKEVVPNTAVISIQFIRQDAILHPEVKTILEKHGKWLKSGNGSFQAQYGIALDEKYTSLWLFRFYDEDCFLVSIMPTRRAASI